MGWLTNLVESVTPGGRARAEDRRARAMLERHVQQLEGEARQLAESVAMADVRLMGLWDRYQGLGQVLYPGGFPQDRRAGRDWPVLKDEGDLRQYRSFSRLLCETNSYAMGFRDGVRSFVVGSGFKWQVVLAGQSHAAVTIDLDGDGRPDQQQDPDVAACQQVLDEFRRLNGWGDDAEARADQDLHSPTTPITNRERETYDRAMEDGNSLLRLFEGDDGSKGVPYLRAVEPECVTTPPGHSIDGPWGWGIKSVVVTDERGRQHIDAERAEAYHLADPERPGELGEVVPAAHIVHFKVNAKSSVKMGVPDFFPIEDELKGSKTLTRNMLQVSGLLSAIAYIREHAPSTTADQVRAMLPQAAQQVPVPANRPPLPGQAGPDQTRLLTVHQAGLIIDVSNQLKYTPGPVNSGVGGFLQAQQAALRAVGIRWGCPEYFSGDASNANFASTLVAGGPFERLTGGRQGDYKLFQGQLAVRVLLFAVKSGRLTAEQVKRVAVKVTAPPVAIADKKGDTDRRKTLFDSKILDPQTWIAEEGYDPAQVAANWKAWEKLFPQQPPPGGAAGGGLPPAAPPGSGYGGDGPLDLGGGLTEAVLLEGGFTGTLRDKRGVVRHYVDGRQVKGHQADPGQGHTGTPTSQAAAEAHVREQLLGGKPLTPEQVQYVAGQMKHMTAKQVARLRADLKAAGHPVMSGRLKQDKIDAIAAFAAAAAKGKPPSPPATPPVPPPAPKKIQSLPIGNPKHGWSPVIGTAFPNMGMAEETAIKLAQKNPDVQYGVQQTGIGQYLVLKFDPNAGPEPPKKATGHPGHTHTDADGKLTAAYKAAHPHAGSGGYPNTALPDDTRPPVPDKQTARYINNYTWGYDAEMNAALRTTGAPPPGQFGGEASGKPSVNGPAMFAALQKQFAAARPFKPPVTVHRGITLDAATTDNLEAAARKAMGGGGAARMPGFISTSTNAYGKFKGNVTFEIAAVHGLDVKPYSQFGHESELLLNHDSRFRVTGVERSGDRLHLKLEQIPPDEQARTVAALDGKKPA